MNQDRPTLNVSSNSTDVSPTTPIVTDLVVSPMANVSVPDCATKSPSCVLPLDVVYVTLVCKSLASDSVTSKT